MYEIDIDTQWDKHAHCARATSECVAADTAEKLHYEMDMVFEAIEHIEHNALVEKNLTHFDSIRKTLTKVVHTDFHSFILYKTDNHPDYYDITSSTSFTSIPVAVYQKSHAQKNDTYTSRRKLKRRAREETTSTETTSKETTSKETTSKETRKRG
jgi:hypothetical protein